MDTFDKIKETKKEVREKMLTLILAGFGLVAALAWNDAIQTLFKVFFSKKRRSNWKNYLCDNCNNCSSAYFFSVEKKY